MLLAKKIGSLLPASVKDRLRPYYLGMTSAMQSLRDKIIFFYEKTKKKIIPPKLPSTDEGVMLNLGCGRINHPKFINIDGYPYQHVHYVQRIDRLNLFSDESVDLIYASHSLEHFRYKDIGRVIDEWVRVLKPGGVLRLSVPDLDKLLAIYRDTGNPDDIVEQVMGGQDNRYNYHYVLFNKSNLSNLLSDAGCVDICEWVPGSDELTSFDDFSVYKKDVSGRSYEVSLNLEARKK